MSISRCSICRVNWPVFWPRERRVSLFESRSGWASTRVLQERAPVNVTDTDENKRGVVWVGRREEVLKHQRLALLLGGGAFEQQGI